MSDNSLKVYWALVRENFKVFVQQAFKTLVPGAPFLDNWHIDAIVYCLERGLVGQMPRLIVNLPPRHLKSLIVSVMWPAFVMGRDPSAKFICVSYSDELAVSLAWDFRRLVKSDWYPAVFPELKVTKANDSEVVTDQGGYRYTTSVGGTLTGRGGDYIIIDDPIKPNDAASDKTREGVNEWFRTTLLSRLNDKEFSVLILVMQRIHVNDLTGYLEGQGGFKKLALPAIASKDEIVVTGPGQSHQRLAGEALHPERENLKTLEAIRNTVGPAIFNAQYQQTPEAPEGNLFKRKYFQVIDRYPRLNDGVLFLSVDSALSVASTANFTAITLVFGLRGVFYVLKAERGRWDYDELRKRVWHYIDRLGSIDRPLEVVVENAGSGISLLTELNRASLKGNAKFRWYSYKPKEDKVARAARTLTYFEQGAVVICSVPGRNDWVEPFVNEFLSFPNGRFDDQVDSLVQLALPPVRRLTARIALVEHPSAPSQRSQWRPLNLPVRRTEGFALHAPRASLEGLPLTGSRSFRLSAAGLAARKKPFQKQHGEGASDLLGGKAATRIHPTVRPIQRPQQPVHYHLGVASASEGTVGHSFFYDLHHAAFI